ncbi:unnamed protein product, partial [Didymodactylos carnosus]
LSNKLQTYGITYDEWKQSCNSVKMLNERTIITKKLYDVCTSDLYKDIVDKNELDKFVDRTSLSASELQLLTPRQPSTENLNATVSQQLSASPQPMSTNGCKRLALTAKTVNTQQAITSAAQATEQSSDTTAGISPVFVSITTVNSQQTTKKPQKKDQPDVVADDDQSQQNLLLTQYKQNIPRNLREYSPTPKARDGRDSLSDVENTESAIALRLRNKRKR